jgi:hypothetical protein
MTATQTQQVSIFNNRGNLLGCLAWWQIKEGHTTLTQLQDSASRNNIPNEFLPKEISGGRGFRRALAKMEKVANSGQKYRGLVLTKVDEDKTRILFTVHERDVSQLAETVDINLADRIKFNKKTGSIDFGAGRYADQVRELLAETSVFYTSNDVRVIVSNLVQNYIGAFSARQQGAVYFVSRDKMPLLQNVRQFIKETVGGDIQDWPVYEEKKKDARGICIENAKNELKALQEECSKAASEGKQVRVFKNRLDALEKYQNQLKGYAVLLEMDIEDIQEAVEESKKSMQSIIDAFADF